MDDSKLNRIINDSKQRRSRAAREIGKGPGNIAGNQQQTSGGAQSNQRNIVKSPPPESRSKTSSNSLKQKHKPAISQQVNKSQPSTNEVQQDQIKGQRRQSSQSDISKHSRKSQIRNRSPQNLVLDQSQNSHKSKASGSQGAHNRGRLQQLSRKASSQLSEAHLKLEEQKDQNTSQYLSDDKIEQEQFQSQTNLEVNKGKDPRKNSSPKEIDDDNKSSSGHGHQVEDIIVDDNQEEMDQYNIGSLHPLEQRSYDKNPLLDEEFMKDYNRQLQELDQSQLSQVEVMQVEEEENLNLDQTSQRNEFEITQTDIQLNTNALNNANDTQSQHSVATPYSQGSLGQAMINKGLAEDAKIFHQTMTNVKPSQRISVVANNKAKLSMIDKRSPAKPKAQVQQNTQQVSSRLTSQVDKVKKTNEVQQKKQVQVQEKPYLQKGKQERQMQTVQYESVPSANRQVKSKVNTGLSRSKSAYGNRKSQVNNQSKVDEAGKKYRLDLSPNDRIRDDLERKIHSDVKDGIKEIVHSRYAELEKILQNNMGGYRPHTSAQINTEGSFDQSQNSMNQQNQVQTSETINYRSATQNNGQQMQRSSTSIVKSQVNFKAPTLISRQKTEVKNQEIKTPKNRAESKQHPQTQRSNELAKAKATEQVQQTVVRVNKKSTTKVEASQSPDKLKRPVKEAYSSQKSQPQPQLQSSTKKSSIVPRLNLNQSSNTKSHQTISSAQQNATTTTTIVKSKQQPQKTQSLLPQQLIQEKQYQSVSPQKRQSQQQLTQSQVYQDRDNKQLYAVDVGPQISLQVQQSQEEDDQDFSHRIDKVKNLREESPANDASPDISSMIRFRQAQKVEDMGEKFNLRTREDVLNFSIEKIWAEMEQIGRNKQVSSDIFKDFQEQFYDRKQANMYDQEECSPTRRLISMKNAVTKHHNIQHNQGMKDGSSYSIQYTTCPEKSYVVKPDQGKIDYDNFNHKKAHLFVEKIINGQVEKIEIKEQNSLQQKSVSPKRKSSGGGIGSISKSSPVRITKEHGARGAMTAASGNTSIVEKSNEIITYSPTKKTTGKATANVKHQNQREQKRRSIVEVLGHQYQQQVDDDASNNNYQVENDVGIAMDTEEYVESDDGYIVNISHQRQ